MQSMHISTLQLDIHNTVTGNKSIFPYLYNITFKLFRVTSVIHNEVGSTIFDGYCQQIYKYISNE